MTFTNNRLFPLKSWDFFASPIRLLMKTRVNHHGSSQYIVQEVWARAILYNFCSEISMHIEIPEKNRKHDYQVNYSQAIKTCRDFLRDRGKTHALDVEGLIAQNIEPIRPGRTFARQARFKLPMSFCYRN